MHEKFIGREKELTEMNELYLQDRFHLFVDISVLNELKLKADIFSKNRKSTYYVLFSKSGFTDAVKNEANSDDSILLVDLDMLMDF